MAFRVSRHDAGGYTAQKSRDKGAAQIMKVTGKRFMVAATVLAVVLVLPVVAQESLLPDGFGDPAPTPAPTPTPAPGARPGGPAAPATTPAPGASAPVSANPSTGADSNDDSGEKGDGAESDGEEGEGGEGGILRYDMPPGARRSLDRIGPLTPDNGGMASAAFGARGQYAARIMAATKAPIASRWASIVLRRALLSAIDTPPTVHGADLAAERAALLLRMGEAYSARLIVQSVDADRGTPRLAQVALQTMLANADPAGLCPWTNTGLGRTKDENSWRLASAMCAALSSEPGPAGSAIERVRNNGKLANFDILLAERVLGATLTGRRAITVQWDGIDRLTSWRFGLATATGTPIPAPLRAAVPAEMAAWAALAPMTPADERVAHAQQAALLGVLSGDAYAGLVAASASDDANEATNTLADALRTAHAGESSDDRFAAMRTLWQGAVDLDRRYAAMVLMARAAAALPVGTEVGGDAPLLIGAMLAGGYDANAQAWASSVAVGSHGWGLLAVGLPRGMAGVDAGTVDSFASDDDSADNIRAKFLVAGLAGLGRLSGSNLQSAAGDLDMALGTETRWTRAIDDAAARGEQGMVALLVATGMQSRDWEKLPPYHLFRMVRALREVGLGSEARMLAAEALVRV
jgi:hypothetical protein